MPYQILANATMIFHFVFLVYVVIGGYLAWRWPRTIWLHLALAGWGFSTIVFGFDCPLTYVEDWARKRAGEQGLSTGFIDTYLEGVIYPQSMAGLIQAVGALLVAVSWVGALILWRRRARGSARREVPATHTTGTAAAKPPPTAAPH